jgi:5'(3')-deoxyribonucleotidase
VINPENFKNLVRFGKIMHHKKEYLISYNFYVASYKFHKNEEIKKWMIENIPYIKYPNLCSYCGKFELKLKKCICGLSRYCNKTCQKKDWDEYHKDNHFVE